MDHGRSHFEDSEDRQVCQPEDLCLQARFRSGQFLVSQSPVTDKIFTSDFIIVDNRVIALKFVESMEFQSGEDLTVDILKDDRTIDIITVSGNKYIISVIEQLFQYQKDKNDVAGYRQAIYDKWRHILTGKSV